MSAIDVTAGEVMDASASLMNDTAKENYTYEAQIPYLRMALKDLKLAYQQNNAPVTNKQSAIITVPTGLAVEGVVSIGFDTTPALPDDLIDIQQLWECQSGTDSFVPVDKKEFIPNYLLGIQISQFGVWTWANNSIQVPEATLEIDLKLDYIADLFTTFEDENSTIGVINADIYLQYRNAALCSRYIGENETRAQALDAEAMMALDKLLGIDNKSKQSIMTRRQPFRSRWKARNRI